MIMYIHVIYNNHIYWDERYVGNRNFHDFQNIAIDIMRHVTIIKITLDQLNMK